MDNAVQIPILYRRLDIRDNFETYQYVSLRYKHSTNVRQKLTQATYNMKLRADVRIKASLYLHRRLYREDVHKHTHTHTPLA